jgi:hypothetical protein
MMTFFVLDQLRQCWIAIAPTKRIDAIKQDWQQQPVLDQERCALRPGNVQRQRWSRW